MADSTWRATLTRKLTKAQKKGPSQVVLVFQGEPGAFTASLEECIGRDFDVSVDMVLQTVVRSRRPNEPDENGWANAELPLAEATR